MDSQRTIYFDTNALGELWRSNDFSPKDLQRVRRRLCSLWFAKRPTVVASQWLLIELAPLQGSVHFAEKLEFLSALPAPKLLMDPVSVMKAEVQAAIRGAKPRVFSEVRGLDFRRGNGPGTWDIEKRKGHYAGLVFVDSARGAKAWYDDQLPDRSIRNAHLDAWHVRRDEVIAEWALESMRIGRTDLALPRDEKQWPSPQTLPSIWARAAYYVAHTYLAYRDGRNILANDFHDWCHYIAAAHADEFITSDKKLIAIAAECPHPKPVVVRFADWARRMLS